MEIDRLKTPYLPFSNAAANTAQSIEKEPRRKDDLRILDK